MAAVIKDIMTPDPNRSLKTIITIFLIEAAFIAVLTNKYFTIALLNYSFSVSINRYKGIDCSR